MKTDINRPAQLTPQVSAPLCGDLGGTTLTPGVYKTTHPLTIKAGNLTLDAQGDEDALWVFQLASDFTTVGGAGGNIILRGGAQAKNIFWETERLASIGEGTSFKGNIIAKMMGQDEAETLVTVLIDEPVSSQRWNALSAFKKPSIMGWPLYGQRL